MSSTTITIPVSATMRKQPDGSFKMVNAEYATLDVAEVAFFIANKLGIPLSQRKMNDVEDS